MGSCNSYCCQKEHEDKNIHIADLQRQIAEMRAEVERITFNRDMFASREAGALAERDRLAAENAALREALRAADQLFAGITPDANTQSQEEMDETRSAIAEAVRTTLASLEDRA